MERHPNTLAVIAYGLANAAGPFCALVKVDGDGYTWACEFHAVGSAPPALYVYLPEKWKDEDYPRGF